MKKKVLHIAEAMGGGVFTYLVELANGMSDEFDVTIAYGIRTETPKDIAKYFEKDVHLVQVQNFCRGLNPLKDIKAYCELRKIVKKLQPDIIHMHSSKAGALGRILTGTKSIKKFYTPHGYSFLMQDVSPVKKMIYKVIEKELGKTDCLTVACGESEWIQSQTVTKNSTFISNGINIEKMRKNIRRMTQDDDGQNRDNHFTVYTIGRIDYQKNPELFNEIAEKMPEINFIWIGDGEMRKYLTSPNITITGWMDVAQLVKLSKSLDVFILPSRWEGLPISLLEAMFIQKPCIVSNVVGNKDVIRDGYSGYICSTAQEFVDTIYQIKEGVDEKIIRKAYKDIIEHYNSGWMCEKYKELYCE